MNEKLISSISPFSVIHFTCVVCMSIHSFIALFLVFCFVLLDLFIFYFIFMSFYTQPGLV